MISSAFRSLARPVSSKITSAYSYQRARLSSDAFKAAVTASTQLSKEPENEVKLKMYALYKQATAGKNTSKKPGMLDIVGKYKWEAWNTLGDMSQEDAQKTYIALVKELQGGSGAEPAAEAKVESAPGEDNSISGLTVTLAEGVLTFRLNNPRRKNPVTVDMYEGIAKKLRESAKDPKVKVAVITGTGDYYSSGNDLKNFQVMMTQIPQDSKNPLAASAERGREVLDCFQEALIEFPKPLIALVNGHAVGIMVTTLLLCDAVLATESATFSTPFTNLAQSPEGCSTLTFPLAMGPLMASDVLLFGRVLTAPEAANFGLITRVLPADSFAASSAAFVKHAASLPTGSLQASKRLIRGNSGQPLSLQKMLETSREEGKVLAQQWQSEECIAAIGNFLSRKK